MKRHKPRALGTGARVALVAPAGPISPERIEASIGRCLSLGLDPIVYPRAAARAICRLSTARGTPSNGCPSGVLMSQINRATRFSGSPHGNS